MFKLSTQVLHIFYKTMSRPSILDPESDIYSIMIDACGCMWLPVS